MSGDEISALERYDIVQFFGEEKYRCRYRINSFAVNLAENKVTKYKQMKSWLSY